MKGRKYENFMIRHNLLDEPDTEQVLPTGNLLYKMEDGTCLVGNVYSAKIGWYMDSPYSPILNQNLVFTAVMDRAHVKVEGVNCNINNLKKRKAKIK